MLFRACLCALALSAAASQAPDERAAWNQPVEPFRIIGNVYYVGAAGVSAFLIHTPEGSILLDGGLPETAPRIADSVKALGFDIRGVRYLLNSHEHFDHAGGLGELQKLSGAPVAASGAAADVLRAGARNIAPVRVDKIVRDGDTVTVGGAVMTAHLTPGHTRGCTSWSTSTREGGRDYKVLFHCSTSVVDTLVNNAAYPEIVSDYQKTFARLASFDADVFLGSHPSFFGMDQKRKKMTAGGPNPFVDAGELRRFNERSRKAFEAELAKQK